MPSRRRSSARSAGGFYAVSFAGGQVDPATGDFVFGVSEGYLIEGGKVTGPCRGATLIGNCLQALESIDAVGNDFWMKTGICGKGGREASRSAPARGTSASPR